MNQSEYQALKGAHEEVEQLRKVLAFYANENNYNDDPSDIPGSPVPGTAPIWVDHGGRAQEALKPDNDNQHWVITVNGWGVRYCTGTEQQAEEWRAHKARWEHGVGRKRLATKEEIEAKVFSEL